MAKGQNLNSKFTGKVGAIVYSVNSGVQIAREYNPIVKNPNTSSQVDQRAKLKLASQLAAALAPVIAIPREGLVTPRNQFIKINMENINAENGVATVAYEYLQLTKGVVSIPAIHAERDGNGNLIMHLESDASAAVSRMVYVVFKKTADNQLQFVDSAIVESAGDGGTFRTSIVDVAGDICIWAYGMKDANAGASAKYGDYSVATGEDIAQLVMSRKLAAGDYQFSKTRGMTLFSGESSGEGGEVVPPQTSVAAPTLTGSTSFTDSVQVSMSAESGAEIRYTTNGSAPNAESTLYSSPITLTETTTIKAIAIKDGEMSQVTARTYSKVQGGGDEPGGDES